MKTPILALALATYVLCSCGSKKTEESASKDSTATVPLTQANLVGDVVCVWEGVPVYDNPNKKAKWLAGISLGESVKYLNEDSIDAADQNREYIKVELYDGKTGWAPTYGLVRGAKLGAIVREVATVYKRPQLAALSDKRLKFMEIVAVGKTEQNFMEVTGTKKLVTGWVNKADLTTAEEDVTAAVLALKIIPADASGEVLEKKLKEFLDAAPPGSAFYQSLNEKYNAILTAKEEEVDTTSTGDN